MKNKGTPVGISVPNLKLNHRAIDIETAWYWLKNRHINQWNLIENSDLNPHM